MWVRFTLPLIVLQSSSHIVREVAEVLPRHTTLPPSTETTRAVAPVGDHRQQAQALSMLRCWNGPLQDEDEGVGKGAVLCSVGSPGSSQGQELLHEGQVHDLGADDVGAVEAWKRIAVIWMVRMASTSRGSRGSAATTRLCRSWSWPAGGIPKTGHVTHVTHVTPS
jgi:hypothetical protein